MDDQSPAMNQRIFQLDLSVEAISLYLLVCSLADSGISVSQENMAARWNGSDRALHESIGALERREILSRIDSGDTRSVYRLTEEDCWKT